MVYIPNISPTAAVTLMMASYGLNSLQYSGFHVNHIDLTPRFAPLLYGVTNSVANTASVISPILYGHILNAGHHRSDEGSGSMVGGSTGGAGGGSGDGSAGLWQLVFTISVVIQLIGGTLWLLGSSGEKQKWG